MTIELLCGRKVYASNFSFGYTYSGLLEGKPSERSNRQTFKNTSYPSDWGSRKVLKIQPEEEEFRTWLKPAHYAVWLHSDDPIDPQYHGSALVVIWFEAPPADKPIEKIIEEGVKSINWEAHAEDFEY